MRVCGRDDSAHAVTLRARAKTCVGLRAVSLSLRPSSHFLFLPSLRPSQFSSSSGSFSSFFFRFTQYQLSPGLLSIRIHPSAYAAPKTPSSVYTTINLNGLISLFHLKFLLSANKVTKQSVSPFNAVNVLDDI